MKRSKIMTIAMITLVITLLSACIISGTLAKYTTSDAGKDEATVAKFGVVAKIVGSLFSDKYGVGGKPTTDGTSVIASGSEDIVAPGTSSSDDGMKVSIKGTPEVSTEISVTIKTSDVKLGSDSTGQFAIMKHLYNSDSYSKDDFDALSDQYDLYTFDGTEFTEATTYEESKALYGTKTSDQTASGVAYEPIEVIVGGVKADSFAAAAREIMNKLGAQSEEICDSADGFNAHVLTYNKIFAPGHVYSGQTDSITWNWKFEGSDTEDTILGDLKVAGADGKIREDYIVYKSGGNFKPIKKAAIGSDVCCDSSDKAIAQLRSAFDIAVTINQSDKSGNA